MTTHVAEEKDSYETEFRKLVKEEGKQRKRIKKQEKREYNAMQRKETNDRKKITSILKKQFLEQVAALYITEGKYNFPHMSFTKFIAQEVKLGFRVNEEVVTTVLEEKRVHDVIYTAADELKLILESDSFLSHLKKSLVNQELQLHESIIRDEEEKMERMVITQKIQEVTGMSGVTYVDWDNLYTGNVDIRGFMPGVELLYSGENISKRLTNIYKSEIENLLKREEITLLNETINTKLKEFKQKLRKAYDPTVKTMLVRNISVKPDGTEKINSKFEKVLVLEKKSKK